jgi:transposase
MQKNMKPADIHRQPGEVYGERAMSNSVVRRWVRHFNEGRENVRDDPRSGRLSVVNEDSVRAVEENIQENRRSTISSLSLHFSQISWSLLHETVSDKLCFWKLCSCWVLKMLMDAHKMKQATWHA